MASPALWTAIAGCITALAGLVTALRARSKAEDAHEIAMGHALDRTRHPAGPRRLNLPADMDQTPPDH